MYVYIYLYVYLDPLWCSYIASISLPYSDLFGIIAYLKISGEFPVFRQRVKCFNIIFYFEYSAFLGI